MSNKKKDYHIYSHNSPYIKTMGEFVADNESIGIGLDIAQILIYQDENNNSNLDKLLDRYSEEDKSEFSELIDKIRLTKPVQIENTVESKSTTNEIKPVIIENTSINTNNSIVPIRETTLEFLLKDPTQISYLSYKPNDRNKSFLSKLYNDDIRALFTKFLFRVESETEYIVIINESIRTSAQQKKQILAGNSASEFSFHYQSIF